MRSFPTEYGDPKISSLKTTTAFSVDDALKLLRNIYSKKFAGMDKILSESLFEKGNPVQQKIKLANTT